MMGECGGLLEAFVFGLGLFITPISKYFFYHGMIQRLYFAKTKDVDIF